LTDELEFLTQSADEDRSGLEYRLQALVLEISDCVTTRLQQQGISQAELARRLGVSRPMITKLLTGDSNFQLRTLLRLAEALEMELQVSLVERSAADPNEATSLPAVTQHGCRRNRGAESAVAAVR
jgi:transcriptional regulator with XRE-family HTH domain